MYKIKKSLCLLLIVSMAVIWLSMNVSASDNKENKYLQITENFISSISQETDAMSEINIRQNNMIKALKSEAKEEDVYPEYYSGCYVNDDNQMVVLLMNNSKENQEHIYDIYGSTDLIIKESKHSYNQLYNLKKFITNRINELKKSNIDSSLELFLKNYIGVGVDDKNNNLFIDIANINEDIIQLFKKYISNSDFIVFNNYAGQSENTPISSINPGYGHIQVIHSNGQWSGLSVGFRAKKLKTGGTYYYGFVTAAHGAYAGDGVYFTDIESESYKIGDVISRQWSGSVDAAFVAIKDSHIMDEYAFYTGPNGESGGVRDHISTTVYFIAMAQGQEVVKNGGTTYRTTGTILSSSFDWYDNEDGITLTDVVKASYDCDHGDSGGIVYGHSQTGGVDYLVAGIVTGKCDGFLGIGVYAVYCKVSNIMSALAVNLY
jgi:hypothetical protein